MFVVESYKIPSSGMEPTLMGDANEFQHPVSNCPFASYHRSPAGDRIIVSKLAYRFSPIRRFDVAVFKFPLNQSKSFVKRVVGLPDEELVIHAGDLFVRPKGSARFELARKPMEVQDRIWIRISQDSDFRGPIDDSNGNPVADVRVSFEVQTEKAGEVSAHIVNRHGALELSFPSGQPALSLRSEAGHGLPLPLSPVKLIEGRWHAVELMFIDGQAVVRLDARILGQVPVVTSLEEAKASREAPTSISFRGRQDGISVRNIRVDRDIHYRGKNEREFGLREDEALRIPAGQYLCFGDNVANSHDSRAWVKRSFVLKNGRQIVCESQQVNEPYSRFNRQLQDRLNLPEPPLYAIDGDEHGEEVAITEGQLDHEESPAPLRFVDRRFFAGRVVRIWWPLIREGPVR